MRHNYLLDLAHIIQHFGINSNFNKKLESLNKISVAFEAGKYYFFSEKNSNQKIETMDEFKQLLAVADRLLGPGGCPWDLEQTLFTLQPYLLEETHELIEAIDEGKAHKISEELGDVLYALIFIAKLGEKERRFTLSESIKNVAEKLIRRHPHVFGEKIVESSDDVVRNWEEIKKQEGKKNPIEGIPPTLPALARAQKVIHKLIKAKSPLVSTAASSLSSEEELGQKLWELIREADMKGYDAESALRRTSQSYEEKFKKGL